jgi:hypothetical protein
MRSREAHMGRGKRHEGSFSRDGGPECQAVHSRHTSFSERLSANSSSSEKFAMFAITAKRQTAPRGGRQCRESGSRGAKRR